MIIKINPCGRMANQMFQTLNAIRLAKLFDESEIFGHTISEYSITTRNCPPLKKPLLLRQYDLSPEAIKEKVKRNGNDSVIFPQGFMRLDFLPEIEVSRNLFRSENAVEEIDPENEIAIHVRCGDILWGVHPDYAPLPFSFYEYLVGNLKLRPVFIVEDLESWYTQELRARWPNERFISSSRAETDFEILRRARNVCIATSTFSWLAAWLGKYNHVHIPVTGFLNPLHRPDFDLLPTGESRYRFWNVPTGQPNADVDLIIKNTKRDYPFSEFNNESIARIQQIANRKLKLHKLKWGIKNLLGLEVPR